MAACISFALFISFLLPILFLSAPFSMANSRDLLATVFKDHKTLQYLTHIKQRTPSVPLSLAIDLGGPYLWLNCDSNYFSSTYHPANCGSSLCSLANLFFCGDCFSSPRPGCNNHTCNVIAENPFTQTSTPGELAVDALSLYYSEGVTFTDPSFLFSCTPAFLTRGLATAAVGVIGLGRNHAAPPLQIYLKLFPGDDLPIFGLCLPSTQHSPGALFFGFGPYTFFPPFTVALFYTNILTNPFFPTEYFIGVTGIKVGDTSIALNDTLLTINTKTGYGGTKLSTVMPYTTLETSIYKSLTTEFAAALANVTRVAAVAPFELCYDAKEFESTGFGPAVPWVKLMLQPYVMWHIFGWNSMVEAKDGVLCFGFVDGGTGARTSIVIGAYQIEETLLKFDSSVRQLGYSESLLARGISCSHFNFTSPGAWASA